MSIYIARGDDTLGPYGAAEAAALIERGYLLPNDFAARDGDTAWVPLTDMIALVLSRVPAVTPLPVDFPVPPVEPERPWSRFFPVSMVFLAMLLAAGWWMIRSRRAADHPSQADTRAATAPAVARPTSSPQEKNVEPEKTPEVVFGPPAPTSLPVERSGQPVVAVVPAAPVMPATPSPEPTPEEKGGRLVGTVALDPPDGLPVKFSAVRVMAFPLDALESFLEQKKARVQAELDQLAPQLAAAETERTARLADEEKALHAFLDADPSDPLLPSLRFAASHAKGAVGVATNDYQYVLDQRREAMDGAVYFQDLPTPIAVSDTNPDGEYTLDLPPGGPYAVAAAAHEETPKGPRQHYWMVKVSLKGDGSGKTLPLSDDNASTGKSPDSLIQTAD